jgi:flagellum-specific ATP synthase
MKALAEQISDIDGVNIYGRVVGVRGLMVEIAGPIHAMSVGARIVVETGTNRFIPCEVIGFTGNNAVVMPFAGLEGVARLPCSNCQCGQSGPPVGIVARARD